MPIGNTVIYNTNDLILSTVSSSSTVFKENKIVAATSSLILFDNNGIINSQSLNTILVGTSSYTSGSTSFIVNLTASNISASGTGRFINIGIGTVIPTSSLDVLAPTVALANQPSIIARFRGDTDGRSLIRIQNTTTNLTSVANQVGISLLNYSATSFQPFSASHEAQIILGSTAGQSVGQLGTLQIIAPLDIALNVSASNTIMTGSSYHSYGTNAMYLTRAGNIGIGTTNPATKLHIQSDTTTTELRIDNTNINNDASILLTDAGNPTTEGTRITYDSSIGDTYLNNIYISSPDAFHFQKNNFGAGTELLTIKSSGDLVVAGDVTASRYTGSLTGSLFGTSSWALTASFSPANTNITASWASSASNALFAQTASWVTASRVVGTVTSASYALSASFAPIDTNITASWATNALTASNLRSTNSYFINNLTASSVSASGATTLNTLQVNSTVGISGTSTLANTIVNGFLSASGVISSSGLRVNGNITSTGIISGSGFTGSLFGTSSWALTASNLNQGNNYTINNLNIFNNLNVNGTSSFLGDTALPYFAFASSSEAWYQVDEMLQGPNYTGGSERIIISLVGGTYFEAGKTEYIIDSRGEIGVQRIDYNGGVTGHSLKIYEDNNASGDNIENYYRVGILISSASFYSIQGTAYATKQGKYCKWTNTTRPSEPDWNEMQVPDTFSSARFGDVTASNFGIVSSSALTVNGNSNFIAPLVALANQPSIIARFAGDTDGRSLIRVQNSSTNAPAAANQVGISFTNYSATSFQPFSASHEAQIILGSSNASSVGQAGTLQIIAPRDIAFNVSASNVIMTGSDYANYGTNVMYITRASKIGIKTTSPLNELDVNGAVVIGSTYAGSSTAPANGLLVQGNVGIGTNVASNALQVNGSVGISGTSTLANTIVNGFLSASGVISSSGLRVNGNITSTGIISGSGFTGSLFGTSSWALTASSLNQNNNYKINNLSASNINVNENLTVNNTSIFSGSIFVVGIGASVWLPITYVQGEISASSLSASSIYGNQITSSNIYANQYYDLNNDIRFSQKTSGSFRGASLHPAEGPRSIFELIHCLSNAIGVSDPLRFRSVSNTEYYSGSTWYTDTNPPVYGRLFDGNANSVVPVITYNDSSSLKRVAKRFVVSFGAYQRPNFITLQSDFYGDNFYGYDVNIEKRISSVWYPAVTSQSIAAGTSPLVAFQLGDLADTDGLRFTFTATHPLSAAGAVSIQSIRGYNNSAYTPSIPVYTNSGSQLISTYSVGIGSSTPKNMLDVAGNISSSAITCSQITATSLQVAQTVGISGTSTLANTIVNGFLSASGVISSSGLRVNGNITSTGIISGSGFTGSLFGTSSWAQTASNLNQNNDYTINNLTIFNNLNVNGTSSFLGDTALPYFKYANSTGTWVEINELLQGINYFGDSERFIVKLYGGTYADSGITEYIIDGRDALNAVRIDYNGGVVGQTLKIYQTASVAATASADCFKIGIRIAGGGTFYSIHGNAYSTQHGKFCKWAETTEPSASAQWTDQTPTITYSQTQFGALTASVVSSSVIIPSKGYFTLPYSSSNNSLTPIIQTGSAYLSAGIGGTNVNLLYVYVGSRWASASLA